MRIIEPTLLLDEKKCQENINFMVQKAKRSNVIFRPHFKTHQSIEVGRWFRAQGVDKITGLMDALLDKTNGKSFE